ncbi:MAG: 3-hydroxyacyl-ACP dehydratase FabZ [Deltaproteobacteria bacterium]|nr:3-hydroxyacyl-ACP dehydratase FabZ [Deltaproteobacteria bacterium]
MDIGQILQYLPHRYPFLLVDKVVSISENHIVGIKNVTFNEPFFTGHFPGFPVMPGVMIIEAMAQTGGIFALNRLGLKLAERPDSKVFFLSIDKARFRKPVQPGDCLTMTLELLSRRRNFWKFQGRAEVDGVLASEAEMMASVG